MNHGFHKDVLMVEAITLPTIEITGGGGWVVDPNGYNIYVVEDGDTYRSLAATYLGSEDLWPMIWNDQSDKWRNETKKGNVNDLRVGDQLYMPQVAIDQAKALGWATGGNGAPPGHATASSVYGAPSQPSQQPSNPSQPSTPTSGGFLAFWNGLSPIAKAGIGVTGAIVIGSAIALAAGSDKGRSRAGDYAEEG